MQTIALDTLNEIKKIRHGIHPGWGGDPVGNTESYCFRMRRANPQDSHRTGEEMLTNINALSDETGLPPNAIRRYAGYLMDSPFTPSMLYSGLEPRDSVHETTPGSQSYIVEFRDEGGTSVVARCCVRSVQQGDTNMPPQWHVWRFTMPTQEAVRENIERRLATYARAHVWLQNMIDLGLRTL